MYEMGAALGGIEDTKIMIELVKLLKEMRFCGSSSQALLSIRESDLTETERIYLAFLLGKHLGCASLVDPEETRTAIMYLKAMAEIVLFVPIEKVKEVYAAINSERGG